MEEKFEIWALVELMGHNKIAGFVTEHKFGNQSMLRVDVPEAGNLPAFSKIVSVSAVYAINPLTESDVREYAAQLKTKPLDVWDMQSLFAERIDILVKRGQLISPQPDENEPENEKDEDLIF